MKFFFVFILFIYYTLPAQHSPTTLDAVISLAKQKSIRSKLAQTRQQLGRFQYDIFKSDLKPQISLYGNLPGFNKEFATVTQPDGTIRFEPIQQALSSFGVAISQKIPFTGGEIALSSDLNRFRDVRNKNTLYNGTPVYVRLQQPLLAVNPLKWQKRIEPLKLKEAEKNYKQELNELSAEVSILYFDVLEAQNDAEIASANLINTTYNFELEKRRIGLGTTGEDKLLQLEVQVLNSQQTQQQSNYRYEVGLLALKNLLGMNDSMAYRFELPGQLPELTLNLPEALQLAYTNRPEFVAFERKRLEAAQQVAEAKAARQQVNLVASYGLNGADPMLGTVYGDAQSQQRFTVGFNVPIINWGRRQAALKTAEAIQQLTEYTNAMDEANFNQEITTLYNNIFLLRKNIALAITTQAVTTRRYTLSNQLYQVGKLTITDLSISQSEKDNASRSYLSALSNFWQAWFRFKQVTGWEG